MGFRGQTETRGAEYGRRSLILRQQNQRMMVRMRGRESVKPGGTAGINVLSQQMLGQDFFVAESLSAQDRKALQPKRRQKAKSSLLGFG